MAISLHAIAQFTVNLCAIVEHAAKIFRAMGARDGCTIKTKDIRRCTKSETFFFNVTQELG